MTGSLLVEHREDILVMTLDRPASRNAIDRDLSHAVASAIDELERNDDLRVGVLTGAGGTFCSGMDLKAHARGESIEVAGRGVAGITRTPPSKPLVAAVEGHALAGGMELVLACDLVVVSEDARLGLPEVRRGLVAGSGGLLRLTDRLPRAVASEIAMTGRSVTAEEALRWGLANRLVPVGGALESALDLAREVARSAPFAVAATKRVFRASDEHGTERAWEVQDAVLAEVFASQDAREGAAAFVEKRAPRWTGR